MISVDEARARLFAAAPLMPPEAARLAEAAGRTLAGPLVAARTQPPFDASAMDGYAVRAADLPGPLTVIGEAAAGRRFDGALSPGEAVRIFTGAPVPEGADTILIQEDAERDGGRLCARHSPPEGEYVRRRGLDFASGDVLLAEGTVLAPRHLALAGAAGHATLTVRRRPRVALLATGDELVPPGAATGPDQIVASVTPALAALAQSVGAEARDFGIAPDDLDALREAISTAIAWADVVVTLGGASVGEHDLVRPALGQLGLSPDFWKVAVRPGKPLMFVADPLVLGLPGNPVSSLVCAHLFLLPLLRQMQGGEPGPPVHEAPLAAPLPANGPRQDHLRGLLTEEGLTAFPTQDSSMLRPLAEGNVLIVREPDASPAPIGTRCRYVALHSFG